MNTQEFVGSLTKNQCRYLLRYAGFSCRGDETRGDLRFAVERNLQAGTIGRGKAARIFRNAAEGTHLAKSVGATWLRGLDGYVISEKDLLKLIAGTVKQEQ